MKLPRVEHAIVDQAKIVDYLLSDSHTIGRHKAAFFQRFGFDAQRWHELANSLKKHASDHEVACEEASPYGRRFIVEGIMETPSGRTPSVRVIWFIRYEETDPRLVSAVPLKR